MSGPDMTSPNRQPRRWGEAPTAGGAGVPERMPSVALAAPVITIDGGAGTGKTTAAKNVSELLGGIKVIDSGLWFRALAVVAVNQGVNLSDVNAVSAFMPKVTIHPPSGLNESIRVEIRDGEVISNSTFTPDELQGEDIGGPASVLGAYPVFREAILEAQRRLASDGCVTAGRAQGTEVFNKDFEARDGRPVLRVLLWADPEVRAQRRFLQEKARPHTSAQELEATLADIKKRDARDTGREIAPLLTKEKAASEGYLVIETTSNSPHEIAQQIVAALNRNTGTC